MATNTRQHFVQSTVAADGANWASCDIVRPALMPLKDVRSPTASAQCPQAGAADALRAPPATVSRHERGQAQVYGRHEGSRHGRAAHCTTRGNFAAGMAQANAKAIARARRPAKWQCGRDRVREPTRRVIAELSEQGKIQEGLKVEGACAFASNFSVVWSTSDAFPLAALPGLTLQIVSDL